MSRSLWVDDVVSITLKGGCVHLELSSGDGGIPLRCSQNTLFKGIEMARRAVENAKPADVVRIPKGEKPRHS